jgi:predicted PurR-regulated permease PerM
MSEKLLTLQRQMTVCVLALVLLFLIFQVSSYFADILRILGISLLLSYLVINIVDFLEKKLGSRSAAILIVYAVLALVTILGSVLVIPSMVYQLAQLAEGMFNSLPAAFEALTRALAPLERRFHQAQIPVNTVDLLTTFATSIPRPDPSFLLDRVSNIAVSTVTWFLYGLSIFVVSFYFMLDGHKMRDSIIALFPKRHRTNLQDIASAIDKSLQAFLRGQVVLAFLMGAIMLVFYLALGVHYALLLSVILAIAEIIPVVGPPLGILPALISVALYGMDFCPGNRLFEIIILALIVSVIQWIKDNVVAPRYVGNVIGVHPVIIFLAIMVGARVDGICGVIFALPCACVVNVMVNHLTNHLPKKHAEEDSAHA